MHHILEILSNPWIMIPSLIVLFGEYIPYTALLWQNIGLGFKKLGKWFLDSYENRIYEKKEEWVQNKKVILKLNNFFARVFFFLLSALIVIFIEVFWELGFKSLTRSLDNSRVAYWAAFKIKKLPNWAVLVLFGMPFIFMELIGIFSFAAFVSGHIWLGVILYLVKVLFFVPVHFILHVGKSQLMAIAWFKRRYDIMVATFVWFKRSQTYVKIHNFTETIRAYILAVKNRLIHTIVLLRKAFEHEDILSLECETMRREINDATVDTEAKNLLYRKFFDCVNSHIEKARLAKQQKGESNGKQSTAD